MSAHREMVTLAIDPNSQQLEMAAALVDAGGQHKRPVKRDQLRKARVVVLALNERREIVGVAVVKKPTNGAAELGDAVILPDYRGQGTAKRAMGILIEEAAKRGVDVLYAKVRSMNVAPRKLLERAQFQLWGDYVKRGKSTVFSWFYLQLSPAVNAQGIMRQKTADLVSSRP